MRKTQTRNGKYDVMAVGKALAILCAFTPETPTLSVTEISDRLKLPKSTAHNLLGTLKHFGFVTQEPKEKFYQLGYKVFELSELFSHNTQLVNHAMPHLRRLADQTKETIKLGVLSGSEVLVIAAIESSFILHTRGDEGRRAPLYCTGLGKAWLATLPDDEIREIAAQIGLSPITSRTITTLDRLEQEVAKIRANGYAVDQQENEQGVCCVAACVHDPFGRPKAVVSVSGPSSRITHNRISKLAVLVLDAAEAISTPQGSQSGKAR
ncbi:MAG: IclR family transcriptional regulator [Acidobacteria bacterium]|nr:IclR family transcriptional regulator [Acidobacteriota bacterium]